MPEDNPLAIAVPLYSIRHAKIGGTEFAIYNLVKGLDLAGARVSVTYGHDEDLSPEFLAWLNGGASVRAYRSGGVPGPKNARFLEEILFSFRSTDDNWIIFPNYFCPPRLGATRRRRAVILHDIQYKVYPEYHSKKRRAWLDFFLPRLFRTADSIVLISQSELDLVQEHFGAVAASRCNVVPNAIDWSRFQPLRSADDLPDTVRRRVAQPYILSVCHLFPHKNVITLLKAFVEVAQHDRDICFYLIGSMSEQNQDFIRASVPEALRNRVEILGFVDDRTLGAYYAQARLYALPSLYEGFGMPPIEAMGFGTPALVSRRYALPEVTLGKAEYVEDPLDVGEWSERITALLARESRLSPDTVEQFRVHYAPAAIGASFMQVLRQRA